MDAVNGYIQNLRWYLHGLECFINTNVLLSYPTDTKTTPLKKDYISVGLEKIDGIANCMGNFLGCKKGKARFGKNMKLVLDVSIFTPIFSRADRCTVLLDNVITGLASYDNLAILDIKTGAVKPNRNTGSYMLESKITIDAEIVYEERRGVKNMTVGSGNNG